ncbi:MAG TPA: exodeoxyribonuclease VII large subunit [Opitutales bacterium]|nr:exodeoxyribonuclease VII large subunit [Opitutales bacterium]
MDLLDERVESVSQLNRRIRHLLESQIRNVWVRGEISNLRKQSSGHSYFSLKDTSSQLSAVLFRGDALRQNVDLRDGMQVLAYGEISVYEPRGTYQLIVRVLTDDGAGRLQLEFEKLKRKLAAEGLFDSDRKRSLPALPETIGYITSPTGAALQDFLRILHRRNWRGRVVVLGSRVQGRKAAGEMIEMLKAAERLGIFDLLVIGRGGGSLEDLWAFNEEPLVRAVADCSIPIISAVGHEIDFVLTDFAADVRAETPSAAAELISSAFLKLTERLELVGEDLHLTARRTLAEWTRHLEALERHLVLVSPQRRLENASLTLDDLTNRMNSRLREGLQAKQIALSDVRERLQAQSPATKIRLFGQELEFWKRRFEQATAQNLKLRNEQIEQIERRLRTLNPRAVLNRGYALVKENAGQVVTRADGLEKDDLLTVEFADGEIDVRTETDPRKLT